MTPLLAVVEQRHGERTDLTLELVEQGVDVVLDLLGDDQLVALPDVRDTALGECLGQLGALLEGPAGEVVVDLDLVGVVGVEVDVESGRRTGGGRRLVVLVVFRGSRSAWRDAIRWRHRDRRTDLRLDSIRARAGRERLGELEVGAPVDRLPEAVALAFHHDQLDVAAGVAHALDERQRRRERHDRILVAVHHEQRHVDAVGVGDRGTLAVLRLRPAGPTSESV